MEEKKNGGLRSWLGMFSRATLISPVSRQNTTIFLTRLTMVYQTYVLCTLIKIPDSVYGTMSLICSIISIIWCPVSGMIIQRSNMRWGKNRSWCYVGGILVTVFTFLLFTDIGLENGPLKYLYYGALVVIVPNVFNFVANVGYTLMAVACKDSKSRADSSAVASLITGLFSLITGYVVVPYITMLTLNHGETKAYSMYALTCVLVMLAIDFFTAWLAKPFEPSLSKEELAAAKAAQSQVKREKASVKEMVKIFFSWPILSLLLASVILDLGGMMAAPAQVYYFNFVLQQPEKMGFVMGTSAFAMIVAWLVAPILRNALKTDKKCYMVCLAGNLLLSLLAFLIPNPNVIIWCLIIKQVFGQAGIVFFLTLLADAGSYISFKKGKDYNEFVISLCTMSGKFSSTVVPALLAFIFAAISFNPAALTPLAISTITATQTWIPGLCAAIAILFALSHKAEKYRKEMAKAGVLRGADIAEAAQAEEEGK
ncbi:MAG: MFS transporter [Firmicutes bacterium]|nr:MFS transporter [Bacillota bacterium]